MMKNHITRNLLRKAISRTILQQNSKGLNFWYLGSTTPVQMSSCTSTPLKVRFGCTATRKVSSLQPLYQAAMLHTWLYWSAHHRPLRKEICPSHHQALISWGEENQMLQALDTTKWPYMCRPSSFWVKLEPPKYWALNVFSSPCLVLGSHHDTWAVLAKVLGCPSPDTPKCLQCASISQLHWCTVGTALEDPRLKFKSSACFFVLSSPHAE